MKLDAYDFKQAIKIGTKWANLVRIWLVYLHHIVVNKTTLGCTAAYNANTRAVFHTGKFRPVSNKTSYCNMTVDKQFLVLCKYM